MIHPEWLIWYGLTIGLSYGETLDLPAGELLDLIAIEQVKHEGAKLKQDEEDDFFELLKRR